MHDTLLRPAWRVDNTKAATSTGDCGIEPVVETLHMAVIDLPNEYMLEPAAIIALIPAEHPHCSAPARFR